MLYGEMNKWMVGASTRRGSHHHHIAIYPLLASIHKDHDDECRKVWRKLLWNFIDTWIPPCTTHTKALPDNFKLCWSISYSLSFRSTHISWSGSIVCSVPSGVPFSPIIPTIQLTRICHLYSHPFQHKACCCCWWW